MKNKKDILLYSSKKQIEKPWYRENETERNEKARKAYEALMTVTLRKPDSKEYKKYSEDVKRRAENEYDDSIYDRGGTYKMCSLWLQF